MQRDAANELIVVFREQQAARRRSIVTRQFCEFLVEVLKAQTEAKGLRILEK